MSAPFVELDGLERAFAIRRGPFRSVPLRAVQDVNLRLERGESLGLVGESGCGKSTLARIVAGLLDPTGGRILVDGRDLTDSSGPERRLWRQNVQIVFQDPHASLNPRRTIFATVAEPLVIHRNLSSAALRARVGDLLETVGLPGRFMYRYPHELSGGQKQRVCIARAVALEPALLVLDEPTSALDVSVQAQILEFLKDLRTRFGLAYLFISHDLSVVRIMCDRVAIMYLGRIVEEGPTAEVFERPRHPYTRALLDAVPLPVADRPAPSLLTGDVPSPVALPPGCAFHRRCPKAVPGHCDVERPLLAPGADPSHTVACHYPLDHAAEPAPVSAVTG